MSVCNCYRTCQCQNRNTGTDVNKAVNVGNEELMPCNASMLWQKPPGVLGEWLSDMRNMAS